MTANAATAAVSRIPVAKLTKCQRDISLRGVLGRPISVVTPADSATRFCFALTEILSCGWRQSFGAWPERLNRISWIPL